MTSKSWRISVLVITDDGLTKPIASWVENSQDKALSAARIGMIAGYGRYPASCLAFSVSECDLLDGVKK